MYSEEFLEEAAEHLASQQDDPGTLLADLRAVKQNHLDRGTPRPFQRFQLNLQIDADDLDVVLAEVEAYIEGENENEEEGDAG